jgi:hypothetical protein
MCERDVNKAPHNTTASLMAKITEVMATLPRATVMLACKRINRRNFISVVEPMQEHGKGCGPPHSSECSGRISLICVHYCKYYSNFITENTEMAG